MPDWVISMGVNALLSVLRNKRDIQKWLAALAKVYVELDSAVKMVPDLAAAVERKRQQLGLE